MEHLTIEQRFALQRARYETARMSRPALEKTVIRLLRSRIELKNGVQQMLMQNGILFKVDEAAEDSNNPPSALATIENVWEE